MAAKKNANPADVRAWLQGDEGQAAIAAYNESVEPRERVTTYVGPRGQFQPVHRDLFGKAHPGLAYDPHADRTPTREFKHKAKDKRGRTITKTVRLTLAEQRALLGTPDSKSRVNASAVVAALEAAAGIEPAKVETPKVETSVEKS